MDRLEATKLRDSLTITDIFNLTFDDQQMDVHWKDATYEDKTD